MRNIARSAILPILAFYLYLAGSAPFLGQWDSYDYLKQIVTHQFSSLGIGRPVFIGYNVLLWESLRQLFHFDPLRVEIVVMSGIVLFGVLGVWVFQRLAQKVLPESDCRMAVIALAISPIYAVYSGFIMTEVPMLVLLMASALVIWNNGDRPTIWRDVTGGLLFGLGVGMREQALTLGAAYLWILWIRRSSTVLRLRAMIQFCIAAGSITIAPAIAFYLYDSAAFLDRIHTWIGILPTGSAQTRINAEASLLFAFVVCPGAWIALAGAGIYHWIKNRQGNFGEARSDIKPISHPVWGFFCCIALPILVLWRDADVQMHPRYLILILPASVIFCAALFRRWVPSRKGLIAWAALQVLFFGLTLIAFSPYRQTQTAKMNFAQVIRKSVPDEGLIISGNLSPLLDYYRGIGVRPQWQILWSGWDWNIETVDAKILEAWSNGIPVYLSTLPLGWSYFEREFLEVHSLFKDCRREKIAPNLYRIFPRQPGV
jgi:hypothetical protein